MKINWRKAWQKINLNCWCRAFCGNCQKRISREVNRQIKKMGGGK